MTFVDQVTFDQIELPEKVYKYRNWTNSEHRRMLTENEIYFAPPLDIDEQHECNLETDYESVTPAMIYKYAYEAALEHKIFDEEERKQFASDTLKTTKFFDPVYRAWVDKKARQNLNDSLSIFCVCEHRDNLNLWNQFAGGQTGFCVGINTRKMLENKTILGGGGKVKYYSREEMPKRKAFTSGIVETNLDMNDVVFSLPDFFSPEDEYRLFKMNLENRRSKIGEDSIEEIILGFLMNNDHKKEIIEISKEKFPKAIILQSIFNSDTESFTFEPLHL